MDLTTEFATYLDTLRAADPTPTDTSSLVMADLPVMRALPAVLDALDDLNTTYWVYLT